MTTNNNLSNIKLENAHLKNENANVKNENAKLINDLAAAPSSSPFQILTQQQQIVQLTQELHNLKNAHPGNISALQDVHNQEILDLQNEVQSYVTENSILHREIEIRKAELLLSRNTQVILPPLSSEPSSKILKSSTQYLQLT